MAPMKAAAILLGLILLANPVHAICGDCNLDGRVTVSELVTAVRNALEPQVAPTGGVVGTPTRTPTPLPDRCSNAQPGQKITVEGQQYIVVEVPVYLEGSSKFYLLRYPASTDEAGALKSVTAAYTLPRQGCEGELGFCPLQRGSICGFPAALGVHSPVSREGYSLNSNGTATLNFSASPLVQVLVRFDADHASLNFSMSFSLRETSTGLSPISEFGYRFQNSNYPSSPFESSRLRSAATRLLDYVSIRAAN